jgi:hypothetical protein
MLLGCSRPSATLAIAELHKKGMLKVERGRVMVVDRDALLDATCECYAIIKANYEQVGR